MSESNLEILVDWLKALRKRQKRIEVLAALNLSAVIGYLLAPTEYERNSTIIFFMVATAIFFAVKEFYVWWSNWRAFRSVDKIREAIYRDVEEQLTGDDKEQF